MQNKIYFLIPLIIIFVASCTNTNIIKIENTKQGKLNSNYQLELNDVKSFLLDSTTSPKPIYIQLLKNENEADAVLTFLNQYNNTIYLYDFESSNLIDKIHFEKDFGRIGGYYLKNEDSIYIYNMAEVKLVLTNKEGTMKQSVLLHDENPKWPLHYPQYMLSTVNPFMEYQGKLLMTGQYFPSLPTSIINKFRYTTLIDFSTNQAEYQFTYPVELYGSDSNWEGGVATTVYTTLSPDGELIHSYPVSHNLYISKWNNDNIQTVYGGSNTAKTITSIDRKEVSRTPNEIILLHYLQQDMYGAILYDPYRKVYYRFLLQGIQNATISTPTEEKPIDIIIMDEHFNYLGETVIGDGKEWNWKNSFVTREGLHIEYNDNEDVNEDYLTFKIFIPKAL